MPNFEDLNEQRTVDDEEMQDENSNDVFQENHCYTLQKSHSLKNQPPLYMNKIK